MTGRGKGVRAVAGADAPPHVARCRGVRTQNLSILLRKSQLLVITQWFRHDCLALFFSLDSEDERYLRYACFLCLSILLRKAELLVFLYQFRDCLLALFSSSNSKVERYLRYARCHWQQQARRGQWGLPHAIFNRFRSSRIERDTEKSARRCQGAIPKDFVLARSSLMRRNHLSSCPRD